ncbi:MFS transporter [Streptomyces acidicola]|uniref:MFS transporter n=1 Tax=Streptomyces acidicola TaxID=2596892 RepID=UPI00379F2951
MARSLWANPYFGWAWAGRFLLHVGYAFFLTFQAYVITDHLGYSDSEAPDLIFYGTLAATAGGLLTAILGGRLSDRLQRRKIFVGVSAAVMGVGLLIIGLSASYAHFLVGGTVVGLGMGTYLAVDMALVARVLPNPDNAAKDLGVFQIANSPPQSLAPLIAPLFLSIGGGGQNHPAAFVAGTVFALLGALATAPTVVCGEQPDAMNRAGAARKDRTGRRRGTRATVLVSGKSPVIAADAACSALTHSGHPSHRQR